MCCGSNDAAIHPICSIITPLLPYGNIPPGSYSSFCSTPYIYSPYLNLTYNGYLGTLNGPALVPISTSPSITYNPNVLLSSVSSISLWD